MSIYAGGQATLQGDFFKDGVAVAVVPRLTVTTPSGARLVYDEGSFENTTTGHVEKTIICSEIGVWRYAFEDINTGAYQDARFDVLARPV